MDENLELLEMLLDEACRVHEITGLAAAVVYRGETLWIRGFGLADTARDVAVTPDTIFRMGSITKIFTSTMLMQLQQVGRLQLDDPVAKYVPAFQVHSPFPGTQHVTLRHLASHTAGIPHMPSLPPFTDPFAVLAADVRGEMIYPTFDQIVDTEIVLEFPPLSRIQYSNIGLMLLGNVLACIAGQPYREYVAQHILQPLGMSRSGFNLSPPVLQEMAVGYMGPSYENLIPGLFNTYPQPAPITDLGDFAPAGQLYSTVNDMARFIAMHIWDGEADEGTHLLSAGTLREMQAPVLFEDDWRSGRAIGWQLLQVAGQTVLGHGGADYGYTAYLLIAPAARIGFVCATNDGMKHQVMETIPLEAMALLLPFDAN